MEKGQLVAYVGDHTNYQPEPAIFNSWENEKAGVANITIHTISETFKFYGFINQEIQKPNKIIKAIAKKRGII